RADGGGGGRQTAERASAARAAAPAEPAPVGQRAARVGLCLPADGGERLSERGDRRRRGEGDFRAEARPYGRRGRRRWLAGGLCLYLGRRDDDAAAGHGAG